MVKLTLLENLKIKNRFIQQFEKIEQILQNLLGSKCGPNFDCFTIVN